MQYTAFGNGSPYQVADDIDACYRDLAFVGSCVTKNRYVIDKEREPYAIGHRQHKRFSCS